MTIDRSSEPTDPRPVARVGSPCTNTSLTLDIMEDAERSRLVGSLVGLEWRQTDAGVESDGNKTAVLGQITSVEMRNRWHEDQTFKNIVKSSGKLPAITELQDTRTATMKVGGCFLQRDKKRDGEGKPVHRATEQARPGGQKEYVHGDLGSVPATGVEVKLVRQDFLDGPHGVLKSCADHLFYLGQDYAGNIKFPMWFKHFGKADRGVGEAYHTGIFGKTGSGKTGLAKMLLAAYGRHREMGILVIDPQGEFTLEMGGNLVGEQGLDLKKLLRDGCGRDVETVTLEDLQLDSWELLEELLVETRFVERELMVRGGDNVDVTRRELMGHFREKWRIDRLNAYQCFTSSLEHLRGVAAKIYRTPSLQGRFIQDLRDLEDDDTSFERAWLPIMSMFAPGGDKVKIQDLVARLVRNDSGSKPIIVLNLSGGSKHARYAEALQKRIISHVANQIVEESAKTLGTKYTANAMIVLDEAHRFAPSGRLDADDQRLRDELKRAVRETRKYGVGWMFISQTMMGLDTELLMQLRTMFFGYGLAFGMEFQRLRELAGGDNDAMDLYRSFRDPHSAMDAGSKQFPFMAIGPISPMPFSGQPLFFSAFGGAEFVNANVWSGRNSVAD